MQKNRFSRNNKLNEVLLDIEEHIIYAHGGKEEAVRELNRYRKEHSSELDYNYVQYGNLLVYYSDVYSFYDGHGYHTKKWSEDVLWRRYRTDVRRVVNYMLNPKYLKEDEVRS